MYGVCYVKGHLLREIAKESKGFELKTEAHLKHIALALNLLIPGRF